MEKRIFLTGPSGGGKSALIREVLGGRLAMAGGFITRRAPARGGTSLCFELCPAAAAAGVEGFEPLPFLDGSVYPPKADNEVFRVHAARLLEEAVWYPFSLLDALGGIEMIIPQFRRALEAYLASGQPCAGVLLPEDFAGTLRLSLGLGERFTAQILRLRQALEADPDTRIVPVEEARRPLEAWAEAYARSL